LPMPSSMNLKEDSKFELFRRYIERISSLERSHGSFFLPTIILVVSDDPGAVLSIFLKGFHIDENHPDVIVLGRDESERVTVESVRENVLPLIWEKPAHGSRRYFVFPHFENITPDVQDQLLKPFEEAPRFISFLLVSRTFATVKDTVLSRSHVFWIPPSMPFASLPHDFLKRYAYGDYSRGVGGKKLDDLVFGLRTLFWRRLKERKALASSEAILRVLRAVSARYRNPRLIEELHVLASLL